MGNCVDRHRSTMWAEEEDGNDKGVDGTAVEQESLLGTTTATELKIKITKRQLEEMLRRVEAQGVPLQNVIAQLLSLTKEGDGGSVGGGGRGGEGGHWRPALQSIPE